jgi:hypothetical protein
MFILRVVVNFPVNTLMHVAQDQDVVKVVQFKDG